MKVSILILAVFFSMSAFGGQEVPKFHHNYWKVLGSGNQLMIQDLNGSSSSHAIYPIQDAKIVKTTVRGTERAGENPLVESSFVAASTQIKEQDCPIGFRKKNRDCVKAVKQLGCCEVTQQLADRKGIPLEELLASYEEGRLNLSCKVIRNEGYNGKCEAVAIDVTVEESHEPPPFKKLPHFKEYERLTIEQLYERLQVLQGQH